MKAKLSKAIAIAALVLLAGCLDQPASSQEGQRAVGWFPTLAESPETQTQKIESVDEVKGSEEYLGVVTRLLDDDLVNLFVTVRRVTSNAVLERYADCAAAQYALIRGYGFARHIRTTIVQTGDVWSVDAIYTISKSLPLGIRTIDANVFVEDCARRGIPTV